jgi:hypothetical protein
MQPLLEFLTSAVFKYFVFPLGGAGIRIFFKYVSRNDQYAKFKKEDFAVGIDLMITAVLMFVVLTTERAMQLISSNLALSEILKAQQPDTKAAMHLQTQNQLLAGQLAISGWLIALVLLGVFSVVTLVRKVGWKSEAEMETFSGVTIPLLIGILSLIALMAGAVQ